MIAIIGLIIAALASGHGVEWPSGAAISASPTRPNPVPVLPSQIEAARKMLDDHLVDYQGSRFRGLHAVLVGDRLSICGEANMRNRMGGLGGWQPFGFTIENPQLGGEIVVDGGPFFDEVCPRHFGGIDKTPPGAIEGTVDLTPALQPVANHAQ